MREPGGVLRLAAEALDELLVAGVPVVEDFDRDSAAELLVGGEIDACKTSRATGAAIWPPVEFCCSTTAAIAT